MSYCPVHGNKMTGAGADLADNEWFECPAGEAWYYNAEYGSFVPERHPGDPLSIAEINAQIEWLVGDDVPLKAFEKDGIIYLGDGVNEAAEVDDRTLLAVQQIIYEWAAFAGYTSEDFETFIAISRGEV